MEPTDGDVPTLLIAYKEMIDRIEETPITQHQKSLDLEC